VLEFFLRSWLYLSAGTTLGGFLLMFVASVSITLENRRHKNDRYAVKHS
jgi:hypothetical protein